MNLIDSVKTCLTKYFQFSGRVSRSEYWWFYATTIIAVYGTLALGFDGLSSLLWLATFIPWLAVTWRRLHDSNLAGPWIFIPAGLLIVGLYSFLFSILFQIMPDMGTTFEDIDMSDDTTLGELRGQMSDQAVMNPIDFELLTGNPTFLFIGAAGVVLAIYLKIRPSTPRPNRFGPNPNEVPS
jgi:uncharacterized membrane protein YhaH (DUF805 family)